MTPWKRHKTMLGYLWSIQGGVCGVYAGVCVDRDQQPNALLLKRGDPTTRMSHTGVPESACTLPLKHHRATCRVYEHSEVLSWQIDWMAASSRKPKFHLNANAGIVLTLQCRVLTLTLSVQPPYNFPSLLLWPHNPKPSLAGNYMHFNTDNKQDLTSKYSAATGFEIWTLNVCASRWYGIIGFFTWSFKSVRPLCKATKRIAKECEISINIGSQMLNQLEKKIFSTYTFFGGLKVGKS